MKQKIKKVLIIAIYLGCLLFHTKVYGVTGITTNETTRLRREASTNSDTIILISQDTEVEIAGEEGDWYQVTYAGYTGYIRKDMLSVEGSDANATTAENNTQAETNTTDTNSQTENNTTDSNTQTETNTTVTDDNTQNTTTTENNQQTANEVENGATVEEQANELTIGYTGKIIASLEIKILPTINSSIIATIGENTNFTITDQINKWCYIETENNEGWVLLSKVEANREKDVATSSQETEEEKNTETDELETTETSAETVEEEQPKIQYVSAETLNVRESTDNNASIVAQLELNTQVTVEEVVDSTWSKITANGVTGYVASKYLSDTQITNSSRSETITRGDENQEANHEEAERKENTEVAETTEEPTQTSSVTGTDVASYAKQYLGYKYVSGGATPSVGFDCSGFTYYVYKHFGITLSRTSSAQASNGRAVNKDNLQAGDLIIFNNSSNSAIGHVGIYIGGNNFIHAANATKGVITTSVSNSYYQARYVSARRIIY